MFSADLKTDRIAWPTRTGFVFTGFQDVVFCKAEGSYTNVQLKNGTNITVSYKLKVVENLLGGLPFFRVHDSYLVNLVYATELKRVEGGYTLMIEGYEIVVAKARKKALMDSFCALRIK
jgi:two-component system, LytTR family, response regulator